MRSSLCTGHLMHRRYNGVDNRFRYPVYFAAIDLDELDELDRRVRLFGHNRRNAFSLFDIDYSGGRDGLRAAVTDFARASGVTARLARIELVTNLRVLGYVFNPVSFYSCFDDAGQLACVVAEVSNTYGGRVRYLLDRRNRVESARGAAFRHPRELFVSPLIHDAASYEFQFRSTEARADVLMHVYRDDDQRFFTAHMAGDRRPFTDRTLAWIGARYPLMTAQVIALIHWEAYKLRRRGVPYRAWSAQ